MTLKHEQVREKLVETTLALMEKGGLESVKARTIANEVGVSVGTVYNLYGSVEGLLLEAGSRIFGTLNALGQTESAAIEARLKEQIASGEVANTAHARTRFRLLALCEVYIAFVASNPRRWGALLAFNRSRGMVETPNWYAKQMEALMSIVGMAFNDSPLGENEERRKVAARALWSAVHGIVTLNFVDQHNDEARAWTWEQLELLISVFVDGLFAEEAGSRAVLPI